MLPLLALLFLLLLVTFLLFSFRGGRPLPLNSSSKILLIIAHPDDESMFFAPVLRGLRLSGHRIFILCVSNGNFYGLGHIRSDELRRAVAKLGIQPGDVTVFDYERLQDGHDWDIQALSNDIMYHVETLSVDCVISFDRYGVSGHKNHTACHEALQNAYTRGIVPEDVQIFVLDSVPLWRKYIGLFDAPLSVVRSPFRYFAWGRDVAACWRAMWAHRSQFVWFRCLFLIFSRYVYINTLRRIAPHKRTPIAKKKS